MRSVGLVFFVAIAVSGCVSNWGLVGDLPVAGPDTPSVLAGCAAGGSVADAEVSGILCTAPTDLVAGVLTDGSVVLLPGPMPFLAP